MAEVKPVPVGRFGRPDPAGFRAACRQSNNLVYFLLNVGDADTQLVLLPPVAGRDRRALIVDVARGGQDKLEALIGDLRRHGLLQAAGPPDHGGGPPFPVVVGTHPHDDHIGGMADFIAGHRVEIGEYWEPGYYHPTAGFINVMRELEDSPGIVLTQPSSGLRRYVDGVRVTVLSPSLALKNRFDSYGVDANNSSITLKIEHPYRRVVERTFRVATDPVSGGPRPSDRLYRSIKRVRSIILAADAQTEVWAAVFGDFPPLSASNSPIAEALRSARGVEPLRAEVLKVPHHASKHGVNLEMVELLNPKFCLVSSVRDAGRFNFPHFVAQESIREALQPTTGSGADRIDDHELGIFYTSDVTTNRPPRPLGSMALVLPPSGDIQMWRFGDASSDDVDLDGARPLNQAS